MFGLASGMVRQEGKEWKAQRPVTRGSRFSREARLGVLEEQRGEVIRTLASPG